MMISLVDQADGETGFFGGSVDGTPAEIDPAHHAVDVCGDFVAVDPCKRQRQRSENGEEGKERHRCG